ncbi:hypothetical protein CRN23_27350 (plasmid) [Klebsiella pneumoniae]|nr:hypothetical protein CRN23_27350 [Klebsiella pneumoniae]
MRAFFSSLRQASFFSSVEISASAADRTAAIFCCSLILGKSREGANKQVISSQADSLIKISRIWADFFPANTSNQPI